MIGLKQSASGWTGPSLSAVIAHALLLQVVTFCFRPALSYATLEAGLAPAWLGVLSAAFALPGLALAIPSGRLSDRFGERLTAVVGGCLMVAATVLAMLLSSSVIALVGATVLFGSGHLLSVIADQAVLANRTRVSHRDSVFGGYALTISLGQGMGGALLAIGAGGAATPDLELQFVLAAALSAFGLVSAICMRSSPRHAAAPSEAPPVTLLELLRRPLLLRAVVASSLVVTAVEISLVYFPALGYERGFPATVVSAMLVARSLASTASRLGLGLWIRLLGRKRVMVGSVAISAVALAALALPVGPVTTIALCVVFGFFNGVSQPLTLSWLSEISPPRQRGTVMSIRIASVRISQTVVPAGVGAMSALVGAGGVLVAVGGLVGVAAWMFTAIGEPRRDATGEVGGSEAGPA